MNVTLIQRANVVYTHDLAETLREVFNATEYRRPLVVTDKFVSTMPLVCEALDALRDAGIDVAVFDLVQPDPLASIIDQGVAAFTAHHADSILAIGGGSAIDTARGINIVHVNGGNILDYTDPSVPIAHCGDLIAVPTTAGTGSELSNALIVTADVAIGQGSEPRKLAVLADPAVSEYAILCPELTFTLPPRMTAACGMDAFCHAAEGYLSKLANPMTDAICEQVMTMLVQWLPVAVRDGSNIDARSQVMTAASLAGWTLNSAGTIAGHSIAHVLGSKYHIVHGEAVAYALPGVVAFVTPVREEQVRNIGRILGVHIPQNATTQEVADLVRDALRAFRDDLVQLRPFAQYGIAAEDLRAEAAAVAEERFAGNTPRPLNVESAATLLEDFGK